MVGSKSSQNEVRMVRSTTRTFMLAKFWPTQLRVPSENGRNDLEGALALPARNVKRCGLKQHHKQRGGSKGQRKALHAAHMSEPLHKSNCTRDTTHLSEWHRRQVPPKDKQQRVCPAAFLLRWR